MAGGGEALPASPRLSHRRLVATVEQQDAAFVAVERPALGAVQQEQRLRRIRIVLPGG